MKLPSVQYEIAQKSDLDRVRWLIRQEYAKQGFLQDEEAFGKLSAYLDLETTTTFAARRSGLVVGTVSVIEYSAERGVPMGSIFGEAVKDLGANGRVAEVGQLAIDREVIGRSEGMKVMFSLFAKVLGYAQGEQLDYLCIVVNPRHEVLYDRLGFKTLGKKDFYGAVSAPAVAKCLEVSQARNNPLIQSMLQGVV